MRHNKKGILCYVTIGGQLNIDFRIYYVRTVDLLVVRTNRSNVNEVFVALLMYTVVQYGTHCNVFNCGGVRWVRLHSLSCCAETRSCNSTEVHSRE